MGFLERAADDPADRHRPVGLMSKSVAPFLTLCGFKNFINEDTGAP